jgi:membrane fusion protein, adhesin transport system
MKTNNDTMTSRRPTMLWMLAAGGLIFLAWAAWFEIDQSVRAAGQVISSSRTQVIQSVDGGVLKTIAVQEGQQVQAGQVLATLEPERSTAAHAQSKAEMASRQAALIRARAELAGQPPQFGPDLQAYPDFVAAQRGLYLQRRQSLNDEVGALTTSLALAQEELALTERLFQSGDVSRAETLRARRSVLEMQSRISALRNKYLQDARQEISRLEDELATARQKLQERASILAHTQLTAPSAGIVKLVRMTTIGGVLRPGDELMQLSPTDEESLIEIKINPADIGQLRTGLPVHLRFDAFDSSQYGTLVGTLNYISSDTLAEQGPTGQTQTYYRARVAIDWPTSHNTRIKPQDIKAGMTATVDVITGQRSVLRYLFKPIARGFSGAMNER